MEISLGSVSTGFKASETLLGIETVFGINTVATNSRFKASETLLGIETGVVVPNFESPEMLQSL